MKLEGMDAARATPFSGAALDPPYGNAGAASAVKERETVDHNDRSDRSEFIRPFSRGQVPADKQPYDRQLQQQDDQISEKVIQEAIDKANKILSGSDRKFEITIHEKTKDVMVRVVDTRTNETIREIPPKKIVDIVVNLCEMAGIMFDQRG